VVEAVTEATTPFIFTTLSAEAALKFVPVITIDEPGTAPSGAKFVIVGGCTTLKSAVDVAVLSFVVTLIFPVAASVGTVMVSCVVVAEETVARALPILTVLFEVVLLKLAPEIVTVAPTDPTVGANEVIVGDGNTSLSFEHEIKIKATKNRVSILNTAPANGLRFGMMRLLSMDTKFKIRITY